MPHLFLTDTGAVYIKADGSTSVTEIPRPSELTRIATGVRPCTLQYRRRSWAIGLYRRPLLRDEFGTLRAGGVTGPLKKPTLSSGGFTGGSEGQMIGYQTFLVKANNIVIAESNPGPATDVYNSDGTGRAWGELDWRPVDSHVTHTRGYASVDGSLPALAWERPLLLPGSTGNVSENVKTAALGVPLPSRIASDGTISLDRYARGVPPYTRYAEKYHNAFFYAGDPEHPERIYPSRLYEPEAVNSTPITVYGRTEKPWLETTDGMPVTGIKRQAEDLVVGTLKGIDVIQGYSYGDYTIRRISDYWGVLSHHSMCRCGPLSSLWFAAPQGPTIYNAGSFKSMSAPIETWWRDNYALYPESFENSYGSEDRFWRNYRLLLPRYGPDSPPDVVPFSLYLNVNFDSETTGDPVWVIDARDRLDTCLAEMVTVAARRYYSLFTGSEDGYVRSENIQADPDDDGDTYLKTMTLVSPHRYPMGQEGDTQHGRTYVGIDVHLKHENQPATISAYAGDDDAPSAVSPQWSVESPATRVPSGERELTVQTSERHVPIELSGKGITLKVEVEAPVDVEFRGWAFDHIPGPQSRPFKA